LLYFVQLGVYGVYYVTREVVGVFVRFRALMWQRNTCSHILEQLLPCFTNK
jgi:hypothetical protein